MQSVFNYVLLNVTLIMHHNKPILPNHIFWDTQVDNLDFDKKKIFIIVRVFERGILKKLLK